MLRRRGAPSRSTRASPARTGSSSAFSRTLSPLSRASEAQTPFPDAAGDPGSRGTSLRPLDPGSAGRCAALVRERGRRRPGKGRGVRERGRGGGGFGTLWRRPRASRRAFGPPQHEGLRGWLDAWFCSAPPPSPLILRSARRARLEGGLQRAPETPSCFETARAAPLQHEGRGRAIRKDGVPIRCASAASFPCSSAAFALAPPRHGGDAPA
jgi:hypothetical protein